MAASYDPGSPTSDDAETADGVAKLKGSVAINDGGATCHQSGDFPTTYARCESTGARSLSPDDCSHRTAAPSAGLYDIPLPAPVPASAWPNKVAPAMTPLLPPVADSSLQPATAASSLQGRLPMVGHADGTERDSARPSESRALELLRQKVSLLAKQSPGDGRGISGSGGGSYSTTRALTIGGRPEHDSFAVTKFKINTRPSLKVSTIFNSDPDDGIGLRLAKGLPKDGTGNCFDESAAPAAAAAIVEARLSGPAAAPQAVSAAAASSALKAGAEVAVSDVECAQSLLSSSCVPSLKMDLPDLNTVRKRSPVLVPAAAAVGLAESSEPRCLEGVQQLPRLAAQSSPSADIHQASRIACEAEPVNRTPHDRFDTGIAAAASSADIQSRSSLAATSALPSASAAGHRHHQTELAVAASECGSRRALSAASASSSSSEKCISELPRPPHKDGIRHSLLSPRRSPDYTHRRHRGRSPSPRPLSRSPLHRSRASRRSPATQKQQPSRRQSDNRCRPMRRHGRSRSRERKQSRHRSSPSRSASASSGTSVESRSPKPRSPSRLRRGGGLPPAAYRRARADQRTSPRTRRTRSPATPPRRRSSSHRDRRLSGNGSRQSAGSYDGRRSSGQRCSSRAEEQPPVAARRAGDGAAAAAAGKKVAAAEPIAVSADKPEATETKAAKAAVASCKPRGDDYEDNGSRQQWQPPPSGLLCSSAAFILSAAPRDASPCTDRSKEANGQLSLLPLMSHISGCITDNDSAKGWSHSAAPGQLSNGRSGEGGGCCSSSAGGSSIDGKQPLPPARDVGARIEGVAMPSIASLPAACEQWSVAGAAAAAATSAIVVAGHPQPALLAVDSVVASVPVAFSLGRPVEGETKGRLGRPSELSARNSAAFWHDARDSTFGEQARSSRPTQGSPSCSCPLIPAAAPVAMDTDQPLAVTELHVHLESSDPVCDAAPATDAVARAAAAPDDVSDPAEAAAEAAGDASAADQGGLPGEADMPFGSLVQQSSQDLSKASSEGILMGDCSEEKVMHMNMEEFLPENHATSSRGDVSQMLESTPGIQPTDSKADSPPKFTRIDENMMLCKPSKKTINMADCKCSKCNVGQPLLDEACCDSEMCVDAALLVECSRKCLCDESCANRRFQRRQYAELELFKTDMKGWGLRSLCDLPSGQFAIEYLGEVVDRKEFRKRTLRYARDQHQHHYFMELDRERMIDATLFGNNSRFINHSCDPNCEIQKWLVGRDYRMGFFTCRPVAAGEELTFDYNLVLYGEELQKCHCGAPNCSGTIGTGKQLSLDTGRLKKKGKKSVDYKYMSKTDIEITRLSEVCKSEHAAGKCPKSQGLARLMMHSENVEQLLEMLQILQGAHEMCRRMFLTFHGLESIWWFASDQAIKGSQTDEFRIQVIKALTVLPVQTKNAVQDTKVLSLMQRWRRELANRNTASTAAGGALTAEAVAAAEQTASDPAPPLVATASEDSSTSAEEVAAGAVSKVGDVTTPDDACCFPSVAEEIPASADVTLGSSSAASATQPTEPAEGSHPEAAAGVVADPATSSNNASEASSPAGQSAIILAGLLDELLDHWSKLKEVFKIPKKQQAEEQQKSDVCAVKTEPDGPAPEDGADNSGGYNRRKSRFDFAVTKEDKTGGGWDATGPQAKAEVGRERSRSSGRSNRLLLSDGASGERKRRHGDSALGGQQRSYLRTSKSARFSRPVMTKEQTRRQFEADVKAKDLLLKATKDRTSSTSSEATPVAPTPQPPGDTGSMLQAVAVCQPSSSAASITTTTQLPPPSVGSAGSSMSQLPVPVSFVDSGSVPYGQSLGLTAAIPPPAFLTARPPPAASHPAAASFQQQQLSVNMQGQHYGSAYATAPPPPPVGGGVFSIPPYGGVFGATSHGTGAYGMSGHLPLPPTGAYSGVPLGGTNYGAGPLTAAYGPSMPLVANYNPSAVSSSYSMTPLQSADPSRTVPPALYPVVLPSHYMQPPVMPQQPQMIQQPLIVNRPAGLQPGVAALPMLSQIRASLSVFQRNLPPPVVAAAAPPLMRDDDNPPPPPAPPRREPHVLPLNWKTALDSEGKTYYYHSVTRETQWEMPSLEAATEAAVAVPSADPGTPTVDEPKQHKKSSKRTTTAAADTSSVEGSSNELRERLKQLKHDVSKCVRACLNGYMMPSCRLGRIENKEDYKHLAQKLTHGIMEKERKKYESMEDVEVTDLVKSKTKGYIKTYMEKFGEVYRRPRTTRSRHGDS